MQEVALEQADGAVIKLAEEVERSHVVVLTRNGREVARLSRAEEPAPSKSITGEEAVRRFEELQQRVRDHWPDEAEFDWKEAIQSGRR